MKKALILIVGLIVLFVIGCSSPEPEPQNPPQREPGAVGVTAGQSGTGTTSGASTGY
ncbi:MAG TPA: hypothetical protein VG820_10280 [Fimbriimonadaceae bacterium]|nr:hypothetical protein [Fimbriimonadaceae bacterium]